MNSSVNSDLVRMDQDASPVWFALYIPVVMGGISSMKHVLCYLRSKPKETQTVMDRAHEFTTTSLIILGTFSSTLRIFQESFKLSQDLEGLAIFLDIAFHWCVGCFLWSIFLNVTTQYHLALNGLAMWNSQWNDEFRFRKITFAIRLVTLAITLCRTSLGERSPMFVKWFITPPTIPDQIPFKVLRMLELTITLGTGFALRSVLYIKFNDKAFESNQLFTDKMFFGMIPVHLIMFAIRSFSPTTYQPYNFDIHGMMMFSMIPILPMFLHKGLNDFMISTILQKDFERVRQFFATWRLMFQLLFNPLSMKAPGTSASAGLD